MGASLHDIVFAKSNTRCRIYAPVGAHEDLLAYLVRRLLENGANSSFVNQIVDEDVPPEEVAADPFDVLSNSKPYVRAPSELFAPERTNSKGWDLHDLDDLQAIDEARAPYQTKRWDAKPLLVSTLNGGDVLDVVNPTNPADFVGTIQYCSPADIDHAIKAAQPWRVPAQKRANALQKAADLYEANFGELFALLTREAGKTQNDAIAELREAVDFLRFYAVRGTQLSNPERGVFTCISPWNFPLAIFSGQIAAALAAGNAVLAKPAESTSIIATRAVELLYKAGIPRDALQLLPGLGDVVGQTLTGTAGIDGVCFTGSTDTAQRINKSMSENLEPTAPLIAETGGLNAMIVDSTALPEQAIRDIVVSAFQSAGQRCSALRVLYLQKDIKEPFLKMLYGAMDELRIGDPWQFSTDIGPVIDLAAQSKILAHVARADSENRLLKSLAVPETGYFVPPSVLEIASIADLKEEIFGPVLHVATFEAEELDQVVADINATGYGLTFGLHTRIDDRVTHVTRGLNVGNIYVNRNQIGAVVGSQPFGGEGMSGTGPKAGGAAYVPRFTKPATFNLSAPKMDEVDVTAVQASIDMLTNQRRVIDSYDLPGPTGESNRITRLGRGVVLCLGPTLRAARDQARIANAAGCVPICVAHGIGEDEGFAGFLSADSIERIQGISAVIYAGNDARRGDYRKALAAREGAIIPLLCETDLDARLTMERHVCIDTTAAGGNASLLAQG